MQNYFKEWFEDQKAKNRGCNEMELLNEIYDYLNSVYTPGTREYTEALHQYTELRDSIENKKSAKTNRFTRIVDTGFKAIGVLGGIGLGFLAWHAESDGGFRLGSVVDSVKTYLKPGFGDSSDVNDIHTERKESVFPDKKKD